MAKWAFSLFFGLAKQVAKPLVFYKLLITTNLVAEREGFEPPVPLLAHLISSQAQSANSAISPSKLVRLEEGLRKWQAKVMGLAEFGPRKPRQCGCPELPSWTVGTTGVSLTNHPVDIQSEH